MNSFKKLVTTVTVLSALLPIVQMSSASAATPSTEMQSTTFSGQCLDVYHSIASVGTDVRLYRCDTTRGAEHIAVNVNQGKLHIYFTPSLCVGSSSAKTAELVSCSSAAANLTETSVNGQGIVRFSSSAGILTGVKPTTTNLYPQLLFQPAKSKYSAQEWKLVTVQ